MDNNRYFQKNILVLGWAKSGQAVTKLLLELGGLVDVYSDDQIDQPIDGANYPDVVSIEKYDLVVKNPGISYQHQLLVAATELKIPIIVEAQVALDLYQGRLIAVTGSNGKSTLVTLIDQILTAAKIPHQLAGNIGTPVSAIIDQANQKQLLLLELSSFQLLGMPRVKPEIAVINNIYQNHLDYHGNLNNYIQAKKLISQNQDQDDWLVLNQNQGVSKQLAEGVKAQIEYFSDQFAEINLNQTKILGRHNLENISAAVKVAEILGIDHAIIQTAVENYSGLEHRLEYVGNFLNLEVYNDSKATDIKATKVALDSFLEKTIWIAGGLDRGDDYLQLADNLKNVEWIITYGQTAPKIVDLAKSQAIEVSQVSDLNQAIQLLKGHKTAAKILLLSPAAASWDQFKNFEERGNLFKKLVKEQQS